MKLIRFNGAKNTGSNRAVDVFQDSNIKLYI